MGLRASNLRMVLLGDSLAPSSYTVSPRAGSRASEAHVSPALVYERFAEGATIVLESLHKYWPPLTDFCRDLELALGHRLQVNAYITPPGSQGFAAHKDDHDVFVLQVSGVKHWIVYDGDDEEKVLVDARLQAGASLYIPKGFPHEATTGESASAHLTVGILTHEVIEIFRALSKLAETEPPFKERIPVEASRSPQALKNWVIDHIDELRVWLDKVDIDELTENVARRVMTSSQPILRGQLEQLELVASIDDDTTVARRRGATCVLFAGPEHLKVLLVDREVRMPLIAEAAMEEIARRDRLQVHELYRLLDRDGALVLVRRLVREGLLEVVVAG